MKTHDLLIDGMMAYHRRVEAAIIAKKITIPTVSKQGLPVRLNLWTTTGIIMMRLSTAIAVLVVLLNESTAFVPHSFPSSAASSAVGHRSSRPVLHSTTEEKKLFFMEETTTTATKSSGSPEPPKNDEEGGNDDGLPWWWEMVWDLDMMKLGEPGTEITFGDSANVFRTNIEQIYGGYPSLDGCPMAEGAIDDIGDGTMFMGLQNYFQDNGSPYKLCFGPKSFLVISDPIQARHILRDANVNYDKGVLAEILEPIMGKGLIPADPETWSVRRRQIVPAFHKAWLEYMVGLFGFCNQPLVESLNKIAEGNQKAEMETFFCSVALDISKCRRCCRKKKLDARAHHEHYIFLTFAASTSQKLVFPFSIMNLVL